MSEERYVELVEILIDFADDLELLAVNLRRQIEGFAKVKIEWNPEAIKWVETEGFKGKYERYPAEGCKPEGSKDYWNMLKDLKAHGGKLTREGYFYWVFRDGSTVGRKKRG